MLENGCGVGMYVAKLTELGSNVIGLEYDLERAIEAGINSDKIINAAGEFIPLPSSTFDLILSHEVIEHVQDDRAAICEMTACETWWTRSDLFSQSRIPV